MHEQDASAAVNDAVRALIVDDEDALRSTLARVLRQRGIVAETAENGFAALDMLESVGVRRRARRRAHARNDRARSSSQRVKARWVPRRGRS